MGNKRISEIVEDEKREVKEFIKITDKRYKEQDKLLKNMITILNKNKDKYQGQKIIKRLKEYYS